MPELVKMRFDQGVAVVTINRPEVRNALNADALAALRRSLERVGADASARSVVLAGERGNFTTGDDLSETTRLDSSGFRAMIDAFQAVTIGLRAMPQPVIAAIEGYAVGAGLEIAAACDMRVCAEDSIFFCPEVSLGLLMSNASSSLLPRLIGAGRTRELVLTGRRFDAVWAEHAGLVNRVVPHGQVVKAALEMARAVAANQPAAVRATKRLLNQVEDEEVARALETETKAILDAFADPDLLAALHAELARWAARKR